MSNDVIITAIICFSLMVISIFGGGNKGGKK